jgi:Arc/MetJ family transcription regulator
MLVEMRVTIILDDELVARARELSGIDGKAAVVHAGLEALIARESARGLAALGGSEPNLRSIRRRRSRRRVPAR